MSDCFFCEKPILPGEKVSTPHDSYWCRDCAAGLDIAHYDCLCDAGEKQEQRRIEDFYGGGGVRPMAEQYREAAEAKRRSR
jgi:hypothetical protein